MTATYTETVVNSAFSSADIVGFQEDDRVLRMARTATTDHLEPGDTLTVRSFDGVDFAGCYVTHVTGTGVFVGVSPAMDEVPC